MIAASERRRGKGAKTRPSHDEISDDSSETCETSQVAGNVYNPSAGHRVTSPSEAQSLFSGIAFTYEGFCSKKSAIIEREVARHEGVLLRCGEFAGRYRHYHIVPLNRKLRELHPPRDATLVTECWLEICVVNRRVCSPKENVVCAPLELEFPLEEFRPYRISVTNYGGLERAHAGRLAVMLGAEFSESFNRRTTHLVCLGTTGEKYKRALEWGTRIVDIDWLYRKAAQTGRNAEVTAVSSAPTTRGLQAYSNSSITDNYMNELAQFEKANDDFSQRSDSGALRTGEWSASGMSSILQGVVVYLGQRCKHLRNHVLELVEVLGAKLAWQLNESCTHYIHKSTKQAESFKEFKLAQKLGVKIVSPFWLDKCREVGRRVAEADYRHTYDPRKVLPMNVPLTSGSVDFIRPRTRDKGKGREITILEEARKPVTNLERHLEEVQASEGLNKLPCNAHDWEGPSRSMSSRTSVTATGGYPPDEEEEGPAREAQGRKVLKQIWSLLSTMAAGKHIATVPSEEAQDFAVRAERKEDERHSDFQRDLEYGSLFMASQLSQDCAVASDSHHQHRQDTVVWDDSEGEREKQKLMEKVEDELRRKGNKANSEAPSVDLTGEDSRATRDSG